MNFSFQICTLFLANTISCTFIFKYIISHLQHKDEQLNFLMNKIINMEADITDLHETIDLLEDHLHKKHIDMRQSTENIINQIDHFIISDYDITE